MHWARIVPRNRATTLADMAGILGDGHTETEPWGCSGPPAEHWDAAENRVLVKGRVPINPHGGSLSEGATQGAGHLREAVVQLRGAAGERQVCGATTALLTPGGMFFHAQGLVLRADDER